MKTFVNMTVLLTLVVLFKLAFCVTVNGQRVVVSSNTSNTTETKLENEFSYSETDAKFSSSLMNITVTETLHDIDFEENVCKIQSNGCDHGAGLCYFGVQCSMNASSCHKFGNPDIEMVCHGYTNYSENYVSEYRGYVENIFCNVSQVPEVHSCKLQINGYPRTGWGDSYASVVRLNFPPKQVKNVPPVSRHVVAITLISYKILFTSRLVYILQCNHNHAMNPKFLGIRNCKKSLLY